MAKARVAIVGAGPAGLMAAEVLSQYDYEIHVYEQKPSAARKFLMAGKTGLNISHAEPVEQFIQRYDQAKWLAPWIRQWDAAWIRNWMQSLGIESYVGSSGRVFPVEMKAAPLLRAWLKRLNEQHVRFHYRHQVIHLNGQQLDLVDLKHQQQLNEHFDAIVLACGAVSWPQLGSDGAWQQWLSSDEIEPFQASNAGVERTWSSFMQPVFGHPLKRVDAWVNHSFDSEPVLKSTGDVVITHYGLESGLIYKQGRALRQQCNVQKTMTLVLDLLPEQTETQLIEKLKPSKKQSLSNVWRKAGLDGVKSSLLRELVPKADWSQPERLVKHIKQLQIDLDGFRPIEEAISCAGGVAISQLNDQLQLRSQPRVFCCGEMLDWDAPTGGYLLTACFATGRAAGYGVHHFLNGK